MRIELYTCKADENKIDKSSDLSNRIILNGHFRDNDPGNMISPSFLVEIDSIPKFINYMYIPEFDSYYYISFDIVRNGIYRVDTIKRDPLMTFKSYIFKRGVILDKVSELNMAELNLNDGTFTTTSKTNAQVIQFPWGFSKDTKFILTVF